MTALQYQQIVDRYIKQFGIKVIKYYKTCQGGAYIPTKQIQIPRPVNEITFYLCLHEIGHIACGLADSAPVWQHEYEATRWALKAAKSHEVDFSKEVMEAIRYYLKHCLKKSISQVDIEIIPDKVFRLAGVSKDYWRLRLAENKKPKCKEPVSDFLHWRNIKMRWE